MQPFPQVLVYTVIGIAALVADFSDRQVGYVSLEELPLVLQRLRDGTSGQSVQKSEDGGKEEN